MTDKEDLAQRMTDAFFKSENLTDKTMKLLTVEPYSPAEIIFAALVIDRALERQVEGWKDIKDYCFRMWKKMDEAGALPQFSKNGDVQ